MEASLDFQSIVMTLQRFWAEQGCLIWQPYNVQVGAGTMNPATYLRVLGPEPWRVAYVEPSIRPDDARYGENPNRMQMHHQFQVILKPDPGNPQEVYLRSLEALGIDPRQHDVRFVEDNWESPALGAWGLGWEVWLDGQEITQFTYFQQAGGQMLNPVSVEITYGLDRIAIALQRVQGFQHIRWNDTYTAGDLNLRGEWEHSKYYFEVADVERLRRMYDLYEQEAEACLAANLVLPAHDYVLKCSHTFNILDTRGAIGVTERQAFFARMRDLSRRIAEAYLEQRQRLEYPWLAEDDTGISNARKSEGAGDQVERQAQSSSGQDLTAPFLFEIGVEELPASDLGSALEQLRSRAPAMLDSLHLAHQEIRIQGTPRRLVVWVEGLASQQPELEQVVKGPPAGKAYDSLGEPTKAAEGFARSKGVELRDLETRQMDGGLYVVARVRQAGRPAIDALSDALPALITSLRFDKSMRWNRSNVAFSRPIRWLLALYGDQVIPFEYAGLRSGRATRGLRFQQPEEFDITYAAEYFPALSSQGIVIDVSERQALVREQVSALASEVEGKANLEPDLLAEVTNLVEAPAGLRGEFDASHLDLPREVLISVMKKHQRYFPVEREGRNAPGSSSSEASQDSHAVYSHSEPHGLQEGEVFGNRESPGWEGTAPLAQGRGPLLPYFIAIRNGDHQGLELVTEGNEHVIRARFLDAAFFIKEDLNRPLQAYLPRLGTLTFQARLGSMLDKTRRIVSLTGMLSEQTDLPGPETAVAVRAAELCKADLVTRMVVEMTSLQGIMGRYYALHSGESEAVAAAIFEHYLPRYSGDRLPSQLPGLVVGLADRLDSLCGLFAADLPPTSAKDPFAQRRAALGLVQNLIGHELDFDLRLALEKAAGLLPIPASPESQKACLEFIKERLRNFLLDQKYRYDVVEAVLAVQGDNPARAARAIKELSLWVTRPDWRTILPAFARCVRITRSLSEEYPHNPQALLEPAESDLYRALLQAEAALRKPGSVDDLLQAFVPMIPAVNRFFEQVLVMTDEATVRENRLGLLQRIRSLAEGVVDLSRLEGF